MWWMSPFEVYKGVAVDKLKRMVRPPSKSHAQLMKDADELGKSMQDLTRSFRKTIRDLVGRGKKRAKAPPSSGEFLLPLSTLRQPDDEPGVLRGTISINGTLFHVEAIEVRYWRGTRTQVGATMEAESFLDEMPYSDGPFDTVRHKGKEYVLHIFPHTW